MISILAPAFAVSVVLLGIHSYFGIRIIRRNIIFADLAIGQMAAVGAAVSIVALDGRGLYPLSLAFALGAALFIALLSRRSAHLEAVIGLAYALGVSGIFILLANAPHGRERLDELMAYDIIYADMGRLAWTAALYAALGCGAYLGDRYAKGLANEVLFYCAFAVTVTSSVQVAGVLVVFALLLAPALIALTVSGWPSAPAALGRRPLAFAWAAGTAINLAAIAVSYLLDLPTGYSLVFANAAAAVAVSAADAALRGRG